VEGSFAHPLYSVKNENARKNAYATLNAGATDPHAHNDSALTSARRAASPGERDRVQQLLFKYREDKLMKEIERIEDERRRADFEKQRVKENF
jgi:hypothetical protein